MKITFLLYNAYGIGGTIRSTVNLSRALSARHEVEIVSVYRTQDEPRLSFGPDVRLTSLLDWRPDSAGYAGEEAAASEPSVIFHDPGIANGPLAPSRLTDERIAAHLQASDADVIIATRPALVAYLARYGSDRQLRIGQEHVLLQMHGEELRAEQNAALDQLDAFVTVSASDADDYRAALPGTRTRITSIPNCAPIPEVTPSTGDSRTIVAAGRLIPVKRYDRLLDAFAKVAACRPDWSLRLYGRGSQKAALRERIEELGLSNQVRLMGAVSPIEPEWAKGAIAAVSSDFESFGMTILEAMHCGVPVVATDCPYGPGEIITHGENGLLSPLSGGPDAFADALLRLIDDQEERHRLAAAAHHRVADYTPDAIARRYEQLIEELAAERGRPLRQQRTPGIAARLRRTLRPARPTPRTADAATEPPAPPLARCRVTPDGSLHLTLTAGPATSRRPQPMDLLLQRRKDPRKLRLRIPLRAEKTTGSHTGTLERHAHVLDEGRWDCYVVPRNQGIDARARLVVEAVEQAALLTLPAVLDDEGVSTWIPYTTADGYLAMRTWLRPAHAEVERIDVGSEAVTVTARLIGAVAFADGARATAVSRTSNDLDIDMPLQPLDDRRFTCHFPLAAVRTRRSAEQDLWDLTVHPGTGTEAIPLGRITGDTADRKPTDIFPAQLLDDTARLRPFFTVNNALSVSVRDIGDPS